MDLSLLLAEESVSILGFTSAHYSLSLQGTEITDISLKLKSRCSGFCALLTLGPQKDNPVSHHSAGIFFPYTHPPLLQPLWWACLLPSILLSQPLLCCMLALTQLLRWLNSPSPGLFVDAPASAVGECFDLMKMVGDSPGDTHKVIWNSIRCSTIGAWWGYEMSAYSMKAYCRQIRSLLA